MARRSVRIKDHWGEQRLFVGRVIFALVALVAMTGIVGARLFWLQVVRHSYYADLSQGNRVRTDPLPPDRGVIYDRHGIVIAENRPAYQLELTPEQVGNTPDTLQRLAAIGLLEKEQLPALERLIKGSRPFQAIPLRLSLSDDEIGRFAVHQHEFAGVEIATRLARWYPFGASAVHALGYVGAISEEDLKHIDRDAYAGSSQIGKIGLEATYEQVLHGTAGYRQVVVNAQGKRVERVGGGLIHLDTKPARAGNDLYLALDMKVQKIAESALGTHRGAVIAIDPSNGDVVTLASTPTYDANLFTRGISSIDYARLRDDPDKPLLNRALRGAYPPGSTVKPMMALAGLEFAAIDPKASRLCHGTYSLPGSSHQYRDWKKNGHGSVDMRRAIATSCDVYFYALASLLGIDRIHETMTKLGFGQLTGIDVGGERPGLMPSPEWKQKTYKQVWFPGETVIIGIGQGYLLATPLQLAHAVAVIASHGHSFKPRLVVAERDATTGAVTRHAPEQQSEVVLNDPSYWDEIIGGMVAVSEAGGTAYSALHGTSYKIAAKTGTAQVFSLGAGDNANNDSKRAERLRNHAVFIAFAPADDPKLAIAVFIENGGHGGSVAAPIAKRVFDAYLLGKYDDAPVQDPTGPEASAEEPR
jgi:penicillin-binding protein 2